jgi:hypothetical protein
MFSICVLFLCCFPSCFFFCVFCLLFIVVVCSVLLSATITHLYIFFCHSFPSTTFSTFLYSFSSFHTLFGSLLLIPHKHFHLVSSSHFHLPIFHSSSTTSPVYHSISPLFLLYPFCFRYPEPNNCAFRSCNACTFSSHPTEGNKTPGQRTLPQDIIKLTDK